MKCEGVNYHPTEGTLACTEDAEVQVGGHWYCWLHETEHGHQLTAEEVNVDEDSDEAETRATELRRLASQLGVDPEEIGLSSD